MKRAFLTEIEEEREKDRKSKTMRSVYADDVINEKYGGLFLEGDEAEEFKQYVHQSIRGGVYPPRKPDFEKLIAKNKMLKEKAEKKKE